jgi:dihydroorotase
MIIEGRFCNHDSGMSTQVKVNDDGVISAIGDLLGKADYSFDISKLIFPGMGDIHIHAREDESKSQVYKECFSTASAAAIQGGVVHVADMPNNPVAPIDDAAYANKQSLCSSAPIHFTLYAGIGPETSPLKKKVPYKAFMGPSIGDLFFNSAEELEKTIARYRGCHVSFHCEDPYILEISKNNATHSDRRPRGAANTATAFALYLIEKYELKGKLCHFSTGDGLDLVRAAKNRGVEVTVETTPQQLYWDTSLLDDQNKPWLQMNPAFRDTIDRQSLIQGLKDGLVDFIATDHAPHRICEKLRRYQPIDLQQKISRLAELSLEEITELDRVCLQNFEKFKIEDPERFSSLADMDGVSGTSQLDTYGAFTTWLMTEHNFSPAKIARVTAWNPGCFVNQFSELSDYKFGKIAKGYVGSFTVIDPETPWTVDNDDICSRSGWSPFHGVTFPGRVEAVFHLGKKLR